MEFTTTLTALVKKSAASFPFRRAISIPGAVDLSYSDLDRLVDAAASLLRSRGVLPGDVVAVAAANTAELPLLFLAILRCRAVAAPLNPGYTREEFRFYLADSESVLLVTGPAGNAAAESAAADLGVRRAAASLAGRRGPLEIRSPAWAGGDPPAAGEMEANEASDVALFLHTSGTTSRPKGVPLTQGNLAASAGNIREAYRIRETDATVLVLPLFHVHGLLAGLLASLVSGAAVTLPASGRFSASTFWADMASAGATWYTAVPTIHQIILERHEKAPEKAYPKLRFIRSCSASLAPSILERLEGAFGAPVLEAYAMTEASHLMATNPLPENGPHKAGSVGRAAGQEMAVLDERGRVVGARVRGEVCVRGPNVTRGYKNNPEANKSAFQFGWFHTGDVGFFDEDGYLHLVGRSKELINRGGEKISPIEVDAVLLSHPDLTQAVAFGVPDDKYGEEINCAVIPREGVEIVEADVVAFCKRNLAAFKIPKKVFITDSLPKTATGKIQRRLVAEHFLSQISAAKVPKFGA